MCEPSLSDSSTFLYLDMLADILMQDSLEMESDFNTKLKFLKEQEHICLDNAQNALPVVETLKSVNHIMLRVEMELHENEINLIEAEKAVTKLEHSYPSPEILAGQTYPLASTTYQDLLSMLMSTKKTADQCNQIKEEFATYNEQISAKVPSVNLVTKLIDCHNNTLESMEKQIEKLQNQVTQVQKEFELLNKEYESQFQAMCPCKKIKELKRKDTTEVRLRM